MGAIHKKFLTKGFWLSADLKKVSLSHFLIDEDFPWIWHLLPLFPTILTSLPALFPENDFLGTLKGGKHVVGSAIHNTISAAAFIKNIDFAKDTLLCDRATPRLWENQFSDHLPHCTGKYPSHQAAGYLRMRVSLMVSIPLFPVKAELLCRKKKESRFIVSEVKKTDKNTSDSKLCWGFFIRG